MPTNKIHACAIQITLTVITNEQKIKDISFIIYKYKNQIYSHLNTFKQHSTSFT